MHCRDHCCATIGFLFLQLLSAVQTRHSPGTCGDFALLTEAGDAPRPLELVEGTIFAGVTGPVILPPRLLSKPVTAAVEEVAALWPAAATVVPLPAAPAPAGALDVSDAGLWDDRTDCG